jgi:APA family basic amino acid/polyamine antiporter
LVSTILKVGLIAGIAVLGFGARGTWSHFAELYSNAPGGIAGFMAALVAALWAYDGWNDLNMVAGEVRNPQRSIPFALLAGMGIIGVLYMSMNAAIQYALPVSSLAASASPAADAVRMAIGPAGAVLVGVAIALSMFVTVNGTIMSGGRVPYAMARDGMFFKALATVHPRFRTPSTSLLVQAALASVLILVIGTFKALFSLSIFAEWLFYMVAASTIFVYRRRGSTRPFAAWGYPIIPGLFIAAAGILLYYTFMENVPNSAAGLLLIGSGIPIYLYFTGKKAASD